MASPEEHVALNITKRCHQRCVFCFEGDRSGWSEPSFDEVVALLERSAERTSKVIFMGGEALIRRDICEVIARGRELGLTVSAVTNGQVLSREGFVEELSEAGLGSMQVSVHFADAETFSQMTQLPPSRFDRLWEGLGRVARFNGEHPGGELPVSPKTVMARFNDGQLEAIAGRLEEVLGASYRDHMLSCISPCETKRPGYLLEPLARRRRELLEFIPRWQDRVELMFSMVPLCLIPGFEHLSFDVQTIRENLRVEANFTRKSELTQMHEYEHLREENPYRWVCSSCTLLPLCPSFRTHWDRPSFVPKREQKPIPSSRDLSQLAHDEVSAITTTHAPKAHGHVEEELIGIIERAFDIDEIYCSDTPVIEFTTLDDPSTRIAVSFPHLAPPPSFPLSYVNFSIAPLTEETSARIRETLATIEPSTLPRAERWRTYNKFDLYWAESQRCIWEGLSNALWPRSRVSDDWETQSFHTTSSGRYHFDIANKEQSSVARFVITPTITNQKKDRPGVAKLFQTENFTVSLDLLHTNKHTTTAAKKTTSALIINIKSLFQAKTALTTTTEYSIIIGKTTTQTHSPKTTRRRRT